MHHETIRGRAGNRGPLGAWLVVAAGLAAGAMEGSAVNAPAADGPVLDAPWALRAGDGWIEPLGFPDARPVFSWNLPVGVARQSAYQLAVASSEANLAGAPDLFDSGRVVSDQSVGVAYGGPSLASRRQAWWRVRYWGPEGTVSAWSEPARLETGLLSAADWEASWIRPATPTDWDKQAVACLRREFAVREAPVQQARLYLTARGVCEARLNGHKVGRDRLAPGWTSYANRIDTMTYDVTGHLQAGDNAIGVLLGQGWYAGRIGWGTTNGYYGTHPELLLQLEVTYADGTVQRVVSDAAWTASWDGPIRFSGFYDGEIYDARREMPGWDRPGFDDAGWGPTVAAADLGPARLVPKPFPPVRETTLLRTRAVTEPAPGRYVFDLGQNMVGVAALDIPVEKDATVTVRFAEMLNPDGTLYTANYRAARSTDQYTAARTGRARWTPVFTFHGFRYVELSGLPDGAAPEPGWVTGIVMHSDLRHTGTFASSHPKLNRLQQNITWGQLGNFVDIPTDCPQRDERMGWTGDAQVFCATSMFNYDAHAFWKSWLDSMRADQLPDGRIPHVIPSVLDAGSPGWMDAATIVPWDVYVRTGDRTLLADNYGMMAKLVAWYRSQATNHRIETIGGFGDWLQPYAPDNSGETPKPLLGTAFYAHSAGILARAARVLGRTADAERAEAEAAAVARAFTAHWFDADGRLQNAPETQTAYLLALGMDLLPTELRAPAVGHLVRLVEAAGGHLRTGFLGTPYLARVLDEAGHPDLARGVLFRETYPSWFYSINQGATTIWERWNSYSHDHGFGDAGMNSFNHYAYGAIGQWMYERLAGLAPDPEHPGYRHFRVRPLVGGPLTSARAELQTPYGLAASGWRREGDALVLEVTVPPNTTATVEFPWDRDPETFPAGSYTFTHRDPDDPPGA